MHRLVRLTFFGIMLVASAASAKEIASAGFDDDVEAKPVLINRTRPLKLNVEVTLLFMPTVVEKYLNHLGGVAGVALHLSDIFAIEVIGGYTYMKETGIIGGDQQSVRSNIVAGPNGRPEPDLPDLIGMSWMVMGGVTIAPIYGKLNILSEVDFNSQVYILGGIGVVGAVRRVFADPNGSDVKTTFQSAGVKFAGDFGLGFRLFLVRWVALRAEFRDIIYSDQYVYVQSGPPSIDIIHNFMGLFGLTFIVNG